MKSVNFDCRKSVCYLFIIYIINKNTNIKWNLLSYIWFRTRNFVTTKVYPELPLPKAITTKWRIFFVTKLFLQPIKNFHRCLTFTSKPSSQHGEVSVRLFTDALADASTRMYAHRGWISIDSARSNGECRRFDILDTRQ